MGLYNKEGLNLARITQQRKPITAFPGNESDNRRSLIGFCGNSRQQEASKRGRKGGSCAQFTAIKDGKSRVTIITFRLSQFTENNIVNEEQRRLHIDYFPSRSPRKATNHCLCFFW